MEWDQKWGEHLESGYFQHLAKKGFLKESDYPPDLGPFDYYLEAFRELSTCRPSSMGIAAIPFTSIHDYYILFGVGDFAEFLYIIRLMDKFFMDTAKKSQGAKPNGR